MKPTAIQLELRKFSDPAIAEHSQRFFKTGKGEYGEGDRFLGVRVPVIRKLARKHRDLPVSVILRVLTSPYHEERLLALLMLVDRFERGDDKVKKNIYTAYLDNTRYINGWDLVDSSAHQVVGAYLLNRDRRKLNTLSRSKSLWERRISIIATYHFIKRDQFEDTLRISRQLLGDSEDLVHKAAGWMLREVGNRDRQAEERFLLEHYRSMPRTMLRYAIEKFDKRERQRYLNGDK